MDVCAKQIAEQCCIRIPRRACVGRFVDLHAAFALSSSSQDYGHTHLVRHYCTLCSRASVKAWPHTCPGPWLHDTEVMFQTLQDAFRAAYSRALTAGVPHVEQHDVVVQFRCSDTYNRKGYGVLPWRYYRDSLLDFNATQMHNGTIGITIIRLHLSCVFAGKGLGQRKGEQSRGAVLWVVWCGVALCRSVLLWCSAVMLGAVV